MSALTRIIQDPPYRPGDKAWHALRFAGAALADGILPGSKRRRERGARWQASERTRPAALGRVPSYVDSRIAAVCAVNGLTLVTRNVADFAAFEDLNVENWLEATARSFGVRRETGEE